MRNTFLPGCVVASIFVLCACETHDPGASTGESDVTQGGDAVPLPARAMPGTAPAASASSSPASAAPADPPPADDPPVPAPDPTATDGIQNGDETDVDCGGSSTNAPKCAVGKACKVHADCESDGCDDGGHCAVGRSCTRTNGGKTCGAGEDATGSCCGAIAIPGRTTKLDTYKITAGRMRAFVERVGGDVKGWYLAAKPSLTAAQIAQIEPYVAYLPSDTTSFPYGVGYQLGGTAYLPALPSADQGCFVGRAGKPGYGSHTFDNGVLEGDDRGFDASMLDKLPLNCVTYPMLAAFCAWDGGRVETYDEHLAAWGTGTYPWGEAPSGGYASIGGTWQLFGPAAALQAQQAACPTCDPLRANWHNAYQLPEGGNPAKPWDYAYWMSAPGRFPLGANAAGHQDLAGLLLEITATIDGTMTTTDLNGQTVTQPKHRWTKSGSWEGHRIGNDTFAFAAMTKYGKTGGRCARD